MAQQYSSPIYSGGNLVGWDTGTYSIPSSGTETWLPQTQTGGSVFGVSTTGGGTSSGGRSIGGGGGGQQAPSQPSWEDRMRGSINDAYAGYEAKLNEIYDSLGGQRTSQEDIVKGQYDQGYNTLTSQRDIGAKDLASERVKTEEAQTKTMRELAEAIRDQFMAGQVMLGTRGAGDSSAANQYAYALTKMGNRQRGDVASTYAGIQNDTNDREFKLNTTYNSEINNIRIERDNRINQIATWFSEQQNNIRQMQAEGRLRKGQDLQNLTMNMYNQAMNAVNQANSEAQNRRLMLDQWAMNNSRNIQQLQQNLAGISEVNYNRPAFQGLNSRLSMGGGQRQTQGVQGGFFNDDERLR